MTTTLAPGVSFCSIGDRLVFLDTGRDRYAAISAETFTAGNGESGWNALRSRGLLIGDGKLCETVRPFACRPCTADVNHYPQVSLRYATFAGIAQVMASRRLARRGLADVLQRVHRSKTSGAMGTDLSDDHLRAVGALRASALLFTQQTACLTRSLALMELLSRRSASANLILGVRLYPFAAHAWVQVGQTVINDALDVVRPFTPIAGF